MLLKSCAIPLARVPDRLHFPALAQLRLEQLVRGDVLGEHEARGASVELDRVRRDQHVDQRPVLLAVPRDHESSTGARGVRGCALLVLGEVADRHPEELAAPEAVVLEGGVVDREKAAGVDVEDPHRRRVAVEEQAEALLGATQRLARVETRVDVVPDRRGAHRPRWSRREPARP